jgi:hypothetical protein
MIIRIVPENPQGSVDQAEPLWFFEFDMIAALG